MIGWFQQRSLKMTTNMKHGNKERGVKARGWALGLNINTVNRNELFNLSHILHLTTSIFNSSRKSPISLTMNGTPNRIHASTIPRSPFGLPLRDSVQIAHQARDPIEWHLMYWINLLIIGRLNGEPWVLMSARIDLEHRKIGDREVREQVQRTWDRYNGENRERVWELWNRLTIAHFRARPLLADLEIMLQDKEAKMNVYLDHLDESLVRCRQTGNHGREAYLIGHIAHINEEMRNQSSAAGNQSSNGAHKEGEDIETDEIYSDTESSLFLILDPPSAFFGSRGLF